MSLFIQFFSGGRKRTDGRNDSPLEFSEANVQVFLARLAVNVEIVREGNLLLNLDVFHITKIKFVQQ